MSTLEFILAFSVAPVGALLIAAFILIVTRNPKRAEKRD